MRIHANSPGLSGSLPHTAPISRSPDLPISRSPVRVTILRVFKVQSYTERKQVIDLTPSLGIELVTPPAHWKAAPTSPLC